MKVHCYCSWDKYEAGKDYEVPAEEGNQLIGTGVAVVVELDKVKKNEKRGVMQAPPKEKE